MRYWSDDDRREAEASGERELVDTSTPRVIVDLALSLIGDKLKITTPTYNSESPGETEVDNARARANFLRALWSAPRYIGRQDALEDAKLNLVLRGRAAIQVSWVKDRTPDTLKPFKSPVQFRSLNPKNVGYMAEDDLFRFVYNTYTEKIGKLAMRYPAITELKSVKDRDFRESVTFTDVWYMNDDGEVWNAFLINNNEFLKRPELSQMPIIPIVIAVPQEVDVDGRGMITLGMLDSILKEWEHECMVESMIMTGLSQSFFRERYVTDDAGDPVPDLHRGPNAINEVSRTFRFVEAPQDTPDFGNASIIAQRVNTRIQKSTFNDAMFGDGGSQRSLLSLGQSHTAGMSRIQRIISSLARLIMQANAISLCMVKKFSAETEVAYAYDSLNQEMVGHELRPDQIHSSYENHVVLNTSSTLSEDMQKLSIALQMVANQTLSKQTTRERLLPFDVPDDEQDRILAEMAMMDPDLLRARIRAAYLSRYGEELPPNEPDMQMTPQQPMPGTGTMPPNGIQPDQLVPDANLPPELQGQISPEALTGNADIDPVILQQMMGGAIG